MNGVTILVLVFGSLTLLLYQLFNLGRNKGNEVQQRLERIRNQTAQVSVEDEMSKSFSIRVLKPILEKIGKGLLRLAPTELINSFDKKIIMAGRPKNWGVKNWLGLQAFMTIGLPVIILIIYLQMRINTQNLVLVTMATAVIGVLYPNMSLNSKIRKRQAEVMKSLPDIMDLLTVSVEAGLTFDSALAKVCEKMPGTLAREFEIVLQEIKVGKSKKDPCIDGRPAGRSGFQKLREAVIQADQLGVTWKGAENTVRTDPPEQKAEDTEKPEGTHQDAHAHGVFIFPSILIVLLGRGD
jgi:tight adherence protein C